MINKIVMKMSYFGSERSLISNPSSMYEPCLKEKHFCADSSLSSLSAV